MKFLEMVEALLQEEKYIYDGKANSVFLYGFLARYEVKIKKLRYYKYM